MNKDQRIEFYKKEIQNAVKDKIKALTIFLGIGIYPIYITFGDKIIIEIMDEAVEEFTENTIKILKNKFTILDARMEMLLGENVRLKMEKPPFHDNKLVFAVRAVKELPNIIEFMAENIYGIAKEYPNFNPTVVMRKK